jgi:hypothetical protein
VTATSAKGAAAVEVDGWNAKAKVVTLAPK